MFKFWILCFPTIASASLIPIQENEKTTCFLYSMIGITASSEVFAFDINNQNSWLSLGKVKIPYLYGPQSLAQQHGQFYAFLTAVIKPVHSSLYSFSLNDITGTEVCDYTSSAIGRANILQGLSFSANGELWGTQRVYSSYGVQTQLYRMTMGGDSSVVAVLPYYVGALCAADDGGLWGFSSLGLFHMDLSGQIRMQYGSYNGPVMESLAAIPCPNAPEQLVGTATMNGVTTLYRIDQSNLFTSPVLPLHVLPETFTGIEWIGYHKEAVPEPSVLLFCALLFCKRLRQ